MISLRKTLVTLLAPLGAATIIRTGFATWSFGLEETVIADPITNDVNVTAEVTNGNIEIRTWPNLLVFSEGTQGRYNLFDGINFYTDKKIVQGRDLIVSGNTAGHLLSFVYSNVNNENTLYFSWKENTDSNLPITGELTNFVGSNATEEVPYTGTWAGTTVSENQQVNVKVVLNNDNSGSIELSTIRNQETEAYSSSFKYSEAQSGTTPDITVTDSTFSFRYKYDNPDLIDENATGYHLNVRMKLALETEPPYGFTFNYDSEHGTLIYETANKAINLVLTKSGNNYSLSANVNSNRLVFNIIEFPPSISGEEFPSGTYVGYTEGSIIPCTLVIGENYSATLEIGKMDSYLSIIDSFTSRCDKDGYFNIFGDNDNEGYAETSLHIGIDKSGLAEDNKERYIDFTCQLANYLRYASPEVKPIDYQKYLGLTAASILGNWTFKIEVCADFTSIRD